MDRTLSSSSTTLRAVVVLSGSDASPTRHASRFRMRESWAAQSDKAAAIALQVRVTLAGLSSLSSNPSRHA